MKHHKIFYLLCLFSVLGIFPVNNANAQNASSSVPRKINHDGIYLFYLHGGVVQAQGANAISPYFGKYEYHAILDTLKNQNFYVISEVRPKNTIEEEYAKKIIKQIDTLINKGVPDKNIVVVGASLGAYIAMEASILNRKENIRFVILGLCSEYALNYFTKEKNKFCGQFLSIYESSDSKGTCFDIFQNLENGSSFEEIELNMGISHAFLFKPYNEWVKPMVNWIKN